MTMVFWFGNETMCAHGTKSENDVLCNGQQPQSIVNGFYWCCVEYSSFLFSIVQCPKIIVHPQELENTVPGKPVSFTVEATGTEPLSYQWQWNPVVEGVISEEWQNLTSSGSVQGANTATLTYSSIESCSDGLYRCVVTNVVGEGISMFAEHINSECQSCQGAHACIKSLLVQLLPPQTFTQTV